VFEIIGGFPHFNRGAMAIDMLTLGHILDKPAWRLDIAGGPDCNFVDMMLVPQCIKLWFARRWRLFIIDPLASSVLLFHAKKSDPQVQIPMEPFGTPHPLSMALIYPRGKVFLAYMSREQPGYRELCELIQVRGFLHRKMYLYAKRAGDFTLLLHLDSVPSQHQSW
jgi:hypothetical protein